MGSGVIAAACRQRKRDRALDLILEGRERVPVVAVLRQRQRLLDQRTRTALARNLAAMIDQASNGRRLSACRGRPLFDLAVVATVADDLRAVVRLRRADRASARGVALAERRLTDACSPLYGNEAELLREELQLVRLYLNG